MSSKAFRTTTLLLFVLLPGCEDPTEVFPSDHTATIDWIPHAIREGASYDLASALFRASVRDSLMKQVPGEVHWMSGNDDLVRVTDSTVTAMASGVGSLAVGIRPDVPQDEKELRVAPFSGRWAAFAVSTYNLCDLDTRGRLSCSGGNSWGQLGSRTPNVYDGSAGQYAYLAGSGSPLPVDTDLLFRSVTGGGAHGCALGEDRLIYCWGSGDRLGNQTDVSYQCPQGVVSPDACRFQPLPVREDLTFLDVATAPSRTAVLPWISYDVSCGLADAGALWCWTWEPWQVFPDTPLLSFDGGADGGCGLSGDGVAYCWGGNAWGQLGIGSADTDSHPEPEAMATDLRFSDIAYYSSLNELQGSHACGIGTDGAAYCWGAGDQGQLGTAEPLATCPGPPDGEPGACSPEPVRVASGETFVGIEAGLGFTCASTTTGEVHCWGRNDEEQLGTEEVPEQCGDVPCSTTPVRVPLAQPVTAMDNGESSVCVGTDDGELSCWGRFWGRRGD